jgi:hypothetical protein
VLGANHRDPVGHEHDSKQHRHDGHHDHTPTMGPAAGAAAGTWHRPGHAVKLARPGSNGRGPSNDESQPKTTRPVTPCNAH